MKFVRYFFGLLPWLIFLGCQSAPNITWDWQKTRAHELDLCHGRLCPDLIVHYPHFQTPDSILAVKLNRLTDSLIIQTLYLGSDSPNFDLSIEQSMSQYLWVGLDYKPDLESAESYSGLIQLDAAWENDSLLILELNSRLLLPDGAKMIQSKRRINLSEKN